MPKRNLYLLSLLSGIILALGWPHYGFPVLLFVGFVPLLLVEHEVYSNSSQYKHLRLFGFSYVAFFTWNILTTWWIYFASPGGAAMAIICNAMLMSFVFILFHIVKKKVGEKLGKIVFISFWLTFEYIHMHWDISWPWLTLGNGFSNYYKWVQWYEYTGVFGGSLWILVVNVVIFELLKKRMYEGGSIPKSKLTTIIILILLPIVLSYILYGSYNEKKNLVNVVVVQPNIDPYNEKFSGTYQEQLRKMLELATTELDSTVDYLIFPETALTESIWEDKISHTYSINTLCQFLKNYPKLKIVIGASTYKIYEIGRQIPVTARKFKDDEAYYDAFNTALQIDPTDSIQIYHKSKLVPGVEKMPFPKLLEPLEKLAIDLGGTTGSLGVQDERTVFVSPDKLMGIAPVICYESIYGEYVGEYIKNGAQLIFIITNDGWWDDSPGYKQHLSYASLRAIETRRSITRSANTGISCFIDQRGDASQLTKWWEPAVIKSSINANADQTFYVEYGDYIARAAAMISVLIILYYMLVRFNVIKKY